MANELKGLEAKGLLPAGDELKTICEELSDVMTPGMFGALSIAPAAAGIFKVVEPGGEEKQNAGDTVDCVIVASHACNVRWKSPFGKGAPGELPACRSLDGVAGVDEDGGRHACAECPYNQFSDDGGRKACTNQRQLYILRPGDVFPILFKLPPSAIRSFDRYRVRVTLSVRAPLHAVLTQMTLVTRQSAGGVDYSAPVFTPVGVLPLEEANRAKAFVDGIVASARRAGILAEDAEAQAEAPDPAPVTDAQSGFAVMPDAELPDVF